MWEDPCNIMIQNTIKVRGELWGRIATDRIKWKLRRMEQVIELLYDCVDNQKLKRRLKENGND